MITFFIHARRRKIRACLFSLIDLCAQKRGPPPRVMKRHKAHLRSIFASLFLSLPFFSTSALFFSLFLFRKKGEREIEEERDRENEREKKRDRRGMREKTKIAIKTNGGLRIRVILGIERHLFHYHSNRSF